MRKLKLQRMTSWSLDLKSSGKKKNPKKQKKLQKKKLVRR